MKSKQFNYYNHLGYINPYYIKKNNTIVVEDTFKKIVEQRDEVNYIDPVSIIEILNKSYTFGDRTFIRDINLTPWMAHPNISLTDWEYVNTLPNHNSIIVTEEKAADTLFLKLVSEVKEYVREKSNVGILLSGGMDSRIIAAVLKYLQDNNEINANITAITWGIKNSRDVVYAERISELFGWKWKHFELSHKNLIENIDVAAKNGALYSPIHLHAMPQVSKMKNIDCIVAGSFGDSVGRAEYSGVKVKSLTPTNKRLMNKFKMIKSKVYKEHLKSVHNDIEKYHLLFPRQEKYQTYELEKQIHYMRKELNQCMSIINQKIPLYQAFTSPDVFGYMWSLAPEVRNDKIYYHILNKYSSGLLDIPWARTGCLYLSKNCDNPDNYLKKHHKYEKWIREDINSIIKEKVLSSNIANLNIFNMHVLENLIWLNSFSSEQHTMIDEYLIWIASLSDFVKEYRVNGVENINNIANIAIDKVEGNIVSFLQYVYYSRNR